MGDDLTAQIAAVLEDVTFRPPGCPCSPVLEPGAGSW